MDRKTRKDHPRISAKDWKDLGYDEVPLPCNLRGSINPIFANYHRKDRGFVGTDEDYDLIMPALRLASKYLYSPRSCIFLYSLVYGQRKLVSGNTKTGGHTVKILERLGLKVSSGSCTEFSRIDDKLYCPKKMDHIWNQLAQYNHFGPEKMKHTNGICRLQLEDGADLQGNGLRGNATGIFFNTRFLEGIRRLRRKGLSNSHQMLSLQFLLATVLCHEVAHAVGFASQVTLRKQIANAKKYIVPFLFLRVPPEPFFEEQTMAELGYSWEKEVIGGKIMEPPFDHPDDFLSTTDWPNGEFCKHGSVQRGDVVKPQNSALKTWIVHMQYIQYVFRQEFWDSLAQLPRKSRGPSLIIPRTVSRVVQMFDSEESAREYLSSRENTDV